MSQNIPIAIQYFNISRIPAKDVFLQVQSQGQPVKIDGDIELPAFLPVFSFIFENSTEAVVDIGAKKPVLIFMHHNQEYIRPEEVDFSVKDKIEKLSENAVFLGDFAMPKPEVVFDLEKETSQLKEKDLTEATKKLLEAFNKKLEPALDIIFTGQIPVLMLLSLACLARPYARNIFWSEGGNKISIFKKSVN